MSAVEIRHTGQTVSVQSSHGTVVARAPSYSVEAVSGILTGGRTPYEGEYTVTPSDEVQVLPTAMKGLAQDITVNPVPSNYGRIAWDGSAIMVY